MIDTCFFCQTLPNNGDRPCLSKQAAIECAWLRGSARERWERKDEPTPWTVQQKHDAALVRALAKQKPISDQPWARMALFIAARAIERGRLLTEAEKLENLAGAFDEDGDHEIAAKIRGAR